MRCVHRRLKLHQLLLSRCPFCLGISEAALEVLGSFRARRLDLLQLCVVGSGYITVCCGRPVALFQLLLQLSDATVLFLHLGAAKHKHSSANVKPTAAAQT